MFGTENSSLTREVLVLASQRLNGVVGLVYLRLHLVDVSGVGACLGEGAVQLALHVRALLTPFLDRLVVLALPFVGLGRDGVGLQYIRRHREISMASIDRLEISITVHGTSGLSNFKCIPGQFQVKSEVMSLQEIFTSCFVMSHFDHLPVGSLFGSMFLSKGTMMSPGSVTQSAV